MRDDDWPIRLAAFEFLDHLVQLHGDILPNALLQRGFVYESRRIPLRGPQGIFKPAAIPEIPLSIRTAPAIAGRERPYEDRFDESGFITYKYRGTDPQHHENVGLRRAMETETPLIYLHGVGPGHYVASWPVYIVGADPGTLSFTVAVDLGDSLRNDVEPPTVVAARREYVTRLTKHRLHQAGFRDRVIRAYRETCAVCRLRHNELLDAAHILPDTHPLGEPIVPNGLALCKLHHSAFDSHIIGIRPDLVVEISHAVLEEIDGPMLIHGLQGFHGKVITVPRPADLRPRSEFLEERYELFRNAG
jgi:putative restriction endonuclease